MSMQAEKSAPAPSVWTMLPGFLWAALCLGVLGFWMQARDLKVGAPYYIGCWLLGVGALALFVVGFVNRRKSMHSHSALQTTEAQLRPMFAMTSLIAGAVLIALAVLLCVTESTNRLQAFAEISSLAVMGIICTGAGISLWRSAQVSSSGNTFTQSLVDIRQPLGMACLALGAIVAGLGVYFFFKSRSEFSAFPGGPEGIGLVLLGLVFLGGGLWTQFTSDRPATSDTMRFLLLYLGSLAGAVISLYAILRFATWWRHLSSGMQSWQGEDAWRFWLCAYVELMGLTLLFGSLLLAHQDIRTNVTMRRVLYGYNAFLTGLLYLMFLVLINIIVFVKLPSNVEYSPTLGLYSISDAAKGVLANLNDKVTVHVLLARFSPSFMEVRNLVENCQSVAKPGKFVVDFVSPDEDDAAYRELARTYPELSKRSRGGEMGGGEGRGLLVVYGVGTEDKAAPHTFLAARELEDSSFSGGPTPGRSFKGEEVLMNTIQQLANVQKKVKVYFTQLSGELWLNDLDYMGQFDDPRFLSREFAGAGALAAKLRKGSFDVAGLVWGKVPRLFQNDQVVSALVADAKDDLSKEKKDALKEALKEKTDPAKADQDTPKEKVDVPADCDVLVIANPGVAFSKEALEAVDRYLARQGKLIILSRAGLLPNGRFTEDGIPELCKKLNVDVTNDIVLGSPAIGRLDELVLLKARVPARTDSKIAMPFKGKNFLMVMPRSVKPASGQAPFQAETILEVSGGVNDGDIWTETTRLLEFRKSPVQYYFGLKNRGQLEEKVSADPVSVGVAVTNRDNNKPRAIVIGDFGFVSSDMFQGRPAEVHHYEFFRSAIEWLADKKEPLLGIPSRDAKNYSLSSEFNFHRTVWLPLGLIFLALAGTGAGVWIVRRK